MSESTPVGHDGVVFERAAPDLLRFFERRTGQDAADLVADTFATAWRRQNMMPSDDVDARRWLFGIAHNVLNNARRGEVRRNRLADRLRLQLRPPRREPIDAMIDVRDAIAALPVDQSDIVTLIHWEGFTSSEVGAILGLPASTVRSRYALAKRQLSVSLQIGTDPKFGPALRDQNCPQRMS